jgi:hypothetical protein
MPGEGIRGKQQRESVLRSLKAPDHAFDDVVSTRDERLLDQTDLRVVEDPNALGLVRVDCDDGVQFLRTTGSSKHWSNAKAAKGHDTDRGLGNHHIRFASDRHRYGLIGDIAAVVLVAQTIENSVGARDFPL